jgi:hypothetical protein
MVSLLPYLGSSLKFGSIYIYIFVNERIYIYIYIYINAHIYMYIEMSVYVYIRECTWIANRGLTSLSVTFPSSAYMCINHGHMWVCVINAFMCTYGRASMCDQCVYVYLCRHTMYVWLCVINAFMCNYGRGEYVWLMYSCTNMRTSNVRVGMCDKCIYVHLCAQVMCVWVCARYITFTFHLFPPRLLHVTETRIR